jgi:hypothetical protein
MAKARATSAATVDTAPARSRDDIGADLTAAWLRSDDIAAKLAEIDAGETAALENDATYFSWVRQRTIARNEARDIAAQIAALETEAEQAVEREELAEYDQACREVADRSVKLVERFKRDVPEAWRLLSSMMRDMAQLQIDRDRLERTRPERYVRTVSILDIENETRSPGAVQAGVVDGQFRHFTPALNLRPFWCDLVFPAFNGRDSEPIFKGDFNMRHPQACLAALDKAARR